MESGGQLLTVPTVLPKVGQATLYIPLYVCKKSLGEVVSLDHDSNMVFTEEYWGERCSVSLGRGLL